MALFAWSYMFIRFSRTPNLWQTDKRADRHRAMAYTVLAHRRTIRKLIKNKRKQLYTQQSNKRDQIKLQIWSCRQGHLSVSVIELSNEEGESVCFRMGPQQQTGCPTLASCLLIFPTFSLPFLFSFFFCLPFPLLSWDVVFRMWHAARPVLQRLGVA